MDHPLVPLDYHTIGKAIERAGAASHYSESAGPFRVLIGHGIYRERYSSNVQSSRVETSKPSGAAHLPFSRRRRQ